MAQRDSEFWTRVRRARAQLEEQFIHDPDVTLIDIGLTPDRAEGAKQIVLRIHVAGRWMEADPDQRAAFPKEVDSIPVIVMLGNYRLDTDVPDPDGDQASEQ